MLRHLLNLCRLWATTVRCRLLESQIEEHKLSEWLSRIRQKEQASSELGIASQPQLHPNPVQHVWWSPLKK